MPLVEHRWDLAVRHGQRVKLDVVRMPAWPAPGNLEGGKVGFRDILRVARLSDRTGQLKLLHKEPVILINERHMRNERRRLDRQSGRRTAKFRE